MAEAARSKGIPSLTGIRGVAALWVLLYHTQLNAGVFGIPWFCNVPLLRSGWRGVDLFFILSGFVLMYVHERDFVTLNRTATLRFAQLRFLRVYPLNAVVLGLIAILVVADPPFAVWYRAQAHNPEYFTTLAFFKTLFLATRWFLPGHGEWNEPVWSLSAEIIGYAAFPLIAWWLAKVQSAWTSFAVAFTSLAGLTLGLILIGKLDGNPIGHFSIVRMGGCFVAGAALCRTWRMAPALPRLWIGGLSWCACLGIVMSCTVPKTAIFALFSLAALVFALAFQQGLVNRVLASKPLVFLGKISFPLYLVHAVPLLWWGYWFHPTGAAAIVLIVADIASCFLAATLLHFTIERPAHALGRRWTDHAIYRIAESPQKV